MSPHRGAKEPPGTWLRSSGTAHSPRTRRPWKLFTWWPSSHHIGDAELADAVIEFRGVDSPGGWGGILTTYAEAVA